MKSMCEYITKTMTPFLINIEIISGIEIFIFDGETRVNNEPKIYQRFLMFHTLILCKKCPYPGFSWSVFSAFGLNTDETLYFSVYSPNAGKCAPEKLRIWTLFTHCIVVEILKNKTK